MREDQRKLALQKIHVNEIKDCQSTAVAEAASKLVHETTPLLTHFQQAGIDWILRDHLVRIITKAVDTIISPLIKKGLYTPLQKRLANFF